MTISLDPRPAPAWFTDAVALQPERRRIPVLGAEIELLTWGRPAAPGLLFLHGNAAHADWWSYLAPGFAQTHRVAALSWSGMGGSDWRPHYDYPTYAAEIVAAIAATDLAGGGRPPVVVAHSFGGFPALHLAAHRPEALSGLVLVDVFVRPPQVEPPPWTQRAMRPACYPSLEAAMARFVYRPAQAAPHGYINDWIARRSLRQIADGEGWTWKFDPAFAAKLQRENPRTLLLEAKPPLALIAGGASSHLTPPMIDYMQSLAPRLATTVVPDAGHHIMVDQPVGLVSALREVLAGWRA